MDQQMQWLTLPINCQSFLNLIITLTNLKYLKTNTSPHINNLLTIIEYNSYVELSFDVMVVDFHFNCVVWSEILSLTHKQQIMLDTIGIQPQFSTLTSLTISTSNNDHIITSILVKLVCFKNNLVEIITINFQPIKISPLAISMRQCTINIKDYCIS